MYRRTLRPDTSHKEHEALTTSMGCQAVQRPPSVQRIVLGVLICVLVLCCAPPLRVIRDGQSVIIDVQTLGEYGTSISRIRLTNATTKTVVWELASKSGEPRIWTVKVQPGSNETRVDAEAGTFQDSTVGDQAARSSCDQKLGEPKPSEPLEPPEPSEPIL